LLQFKVAIAIALYSYFGQQLRLVIAKLSVDGQVQARLTALDSVPIGVQQHDSVTRDAHFRLTLDWDIQTA
jgi:hypothetical protein